MLACARIGAPHSVIFGGFSANALVDRITDQEAVAVITQDGSYRRGGEVKLKATVDEALDRCPTVKHVVVYKRSGCDVEWREGRDHWWHELMADASDNCPAEPLDSEHPLYILYTSGTTGKAEGHRAHHRRLLGRDVHHQQMGLRSEGRRHVLVHRRHRLGDRAQLHRVRSAAERRDRADVRRRAELAGVRSLLGDHREAQGQHALHRANRDPHLHQVGRRVAEEARPEQPAPAGHGGRADQSRSLDVVSRSHRRQPLPDRRYLVADRDRRDHDHADSGSGRDQAGLGDASVSRASRRKS